MKDKIDLSYKIEKQEGIINGKDLATEMLGDALQLLHGYTNGCHACTVDLARMLLEDAGTEFFKEKPKGMVFDLEEDEDKSIRWETHFDREHSLVSDYMKEKIAEFVARDLEHSH
ncbi:MAG: hypothetical protein JKX87_07630 [Cycloclasticus sp.]|nr:hypothetical protein [Cycloclasticus sp.]